MAKEYTVELQKLFLEIMLQDAQTFVRVQNIYNSENFDRSLREAAEFIKEHADKYKTLPTKDQIRAVANVELKEVPDIGEDHTEWFLTEFESFSRRQELERAILKSADLLEKGDFDPVEKLIKDAVQISLTKDMGTDYFADPRSRLMRIKDNNGQVSTGWPTMDQKLFGGMNRGELNIFAGGSGSGKSLFMQNISVNWLDQGLNGVYVTLELSEELCSMRIDSMVADVSSKEVFKNIDDVEMKVRMKAKKAGKFRVKYMPAQSNVNQLRAYLKELQIQEGIKLDFVMVDYLDLLMPVSAKVSPSDLFIKDKYVSEELRNLAKEFKVLLITASQLNRAAVEEVEFDHSHISGGISKINTADNVFGIFTSRAMRERGQYQIQLMKTRSSSGVGQKIDLNFDLETLRISDSGEGNPQYSNPGSPSSILNRIKTQSNVTANTSTSGTTFQRGQPKPGFDLNAPRPTGSVDSTKLQNMLANLKK